LSVLRQLTPHASSKATDAERTVPAAASKPFSRFILALILLGTVTAAYLNHFGNGFHFDDVHTVVDNPSIRSLANIPKFWTEAETFSVLPSNQSYRPVISTTLAIDYWLGGGLKPFFFHLDTFVWYLAQLVVMFLLFEQVFDLARPDRRNRYIALFTVAWYGLHPAMAETVNYVIQRGDLLSTVGVVLALWLYTKSASARRYHLYLLPAALAQLTKPPALVFPFLLWGYLSICEEMPWRTAVRKCLPALAGAIAAGWFQAAMTPPTFSSGAVSAYAFRITQPLVSLHQFRNLFFPFWLSADTDHLPLTTIWCDQAWFGIIFVLAAITTAVVTLRRRETRPIAFGLLWYLVAQAPTALFAVAEVENDHRMFFPLVGLVLSVGWAAGLTLPRSWSRAAAAAAVLLLSAYAWGTWQRNRVWRTDESLWSDVTIKSPANGRGLMNYGLSLITKGDTATALDYFNRAAVFTPNYAQLQTNLGIAHAALGHDTEAETHFRRALTLAPAYGQGHFFYARWLQQKRRSQEAAMEVRTAISLSPSLMEARYLYLQSLWAARDLPALAKQVDEVLKLQPSDSVALDYRARVTGLHGPLQLAKDKVKKEPTAENFLNLSLAYYDEGEFEPSLQAAREALRVQPEYAEAYNNISAACASLQRWDEAIAAGREALRIRPDFPLARNNLAWAEAMRNTAAQSK
jgi:tetratricopeptide (TPR) repeat protein